MCRIVKKLSLRHLEGNHLSTTFSSHNFRSIDPSFKALYLPYIKINPVNYFILNTCYEKAIYYIPGINGSYFPGTNFKNLGNKIKQRVETKTENKVLDDVDKKTDAVLSPGKTGKKNDASKADNSSVSNTGDKSSPGPASFKAYSKYDFVPGEKVIGFEDFSTGSIGDFPAGWNTTGSGEIVTVEGKQGRWLWISKPGVFVPEFTDKYPEDFTFEFDLLHGVPINGAQFHFVMAELQDVAQAQHWSIASNRYTLGLFTGNSDQKKAPLLQI